MKYPILVAKEGPVHLSQELGSEPRRLRGWPGSSVSQMFSSLVSQELCICSKVALDFILSIFASHMEFQVTEKKGM